MTEECITENAITAATPGSILRKARSAAGLSHQDVATKLNLRVQQVIAIEEDRYDEFLAPIYAKGQIRNYANLLKIDPLPLAASFDEQAKRQKIEKSKPLARPVRPQVNATSHRHLHIALAAFLLILLVLWWQADNHDFFADNVSITEAVPAERDNELAVSTGALNPAVADYDGNQDSVVDPLAGETTQMVQAQLLAQSDSVNAEISDAVVEESTVSDRPVSENSVADSINQAVQLLHSLSFSFSGDCWVEVKDRDNNVLAASLKHADDELTVSGQAPFSVILGYAPVVSLQYNGEPVDIEADEATNAARLTVGKS